MLPELIHEFRLFGRNSVLNFFRGEGPEYSDILREVANKCNVSFNNATAKDENVELLLFDKLIKDALDGASDDELRRMMHELNINMPKFNRYRATIHIEKLWKSGTTEGFTLMASIIEYFNY